MGDVTPLLIDFWIWLALIGVWAVGALSAGRARWREGWVGRAAHVVPVCAGFWLLFAKRGVGPLDDRLYENDALAWLGVLMTGAGVGFAIWARVTLGRYWSGVITLKEGHRLVRTGPYAVARHPIYTGLIVAALGTALSAARVDALAGFGVVAASLVLKLRREEAVLAGAFGEEYARYRGKVPALFPMGWLGGERGIESDAFEQAVLRSDRYRVLGIVCVCAAAAVMDVAEALANPHVARRYWMFMGGWGVLAAYEAGFFWVASAVARRTGRRVRSWVWGVNTVVECLLPSLALLGLTADKSYMGPYRALMSPTVSIYFLLIILSVLRLSPWLCVTAGGVCAAGYWGVFLLTQRLAPWNDYRHMMPDRAYAMYAVMIAGAGLVAASVAGRVRRHVVAALAEAETRRALDRIEYDLGVARSIQSGLLPGRAPDVDGYDVAGWSRPADHTGGDFYDWVDVPGRGLMVTIADVTGHGVGPALLAASCRASFRAVAGQGESVERVVRRVGALMEADVSDGRFITAAVALLDPVGHRVRLYSAGHAPIYLYTAATGRVTVLDADLPPLGVPAGDDEAAPEARVIALAPGDSLVLVTDGFFECCNRAGAMLGISGLAELIAGRHASSARQTIDQMYQRVVEFSEGLAQADDLTAVVITRRRGGVGLPCDRE